MSESPESNQNQMTFDVNKDDRKDVVVFTSAYDDTEPKIIRLALTHEGIIMDFYENAELSSTIGMTYEEWFGFSSKGPAMTSKSTKPRHRR